MWLQESVAMNDYELEIKSEICIHCNAQKAQVKEKTKRQQLYIAKWKFIKNEWIRFQAF